MGFRFGIAAVCTLAVGVTAARAEDGHGIMQLAFASPSAALHLPEHWRVPAPPMAAQPRPAHAVRKQPEPAKAVDSALKLGTADLQSGYEQLFPPAPPHAAKSVAQTDARAGSNGRSAEFWTVLNGPGPSKQDALSSLGAGSEAPRNLLVALRAGF